MPPAILVIDQGTTSTRAIVFGPDALPAATAQEEFPQVFPQPGWVEHDPDDLWRTSVSTARIALGHAEAAGLQVMALGLTNQRETILVWDRKTGTPIHRAIVWQDRRTAQACAKLKAEGAEDLVQARSGLLLDPYFSRDQDRLAPRSRRGRPREGATGRSRLRDRRHLSPVEVHQRHGPCDRRDERLADRALRHPRGSVGRRPPRPLPDPPRHPAPRPR